MTLTTTTPQGEKLSELDGSEVASLRRLNGNKVMQVLRAEAYRKFTVREMALATGLSRPTVARLLDDFVATKWAQSEEGRPGGTGRPAKRYWFNRLRGVLISIDLGPRACFVMVTDLVGTELAWESVIDADFSTPELIDAALLPFLDTVVNQIPECPPVVGASLGAPALFDAEGTVVTSRFVPGWIGTNLRDVVTRAFPDAAVVTDNDAALMAEAELRFGALADSHHGMYLHTGLFSSILLINDGAVHRGAHGLAGDIGALSEYRWQDILDAEIGSVEPDLPPSTNRVVLAARAGDERYLDALRTVGKALARGVSDVAAAWDPDTVVIGGFLLDAGDTALEPIRDALQELGGDDYEVREASIPPLKSAALGGIIRALSLVE